METSIRLSVEKDLQKHCEFSVRKIPKAKTHRWTGHYEPEVIEAFHELQHPIVTVKDILGPGQVRFKADDSEETDIEMEPGTAYPSGDVLDSQLFCLVCTQCESGSIMANCDCTAAVAYRSMTRLFSRKRPRRSACEETFAKIGEFITAKRQQMNSPEWEESPSSPIASDEPLGGAGAIPASPDDAGAIFASSGGAGAILASPASADPRTDQRPQSSAGSGERERDAPPPKKNKQT